MQEQIPQSAGRTSRFHEFLVTWRGIIFNALMLVYILLVQSPFLSLVRESADMGRKNIPLGIFILGLMLAQLAALFAKLPAVIRRTAMSDMRKLPPGGWIIYLVWSIQMMLSAFLLIVALPALGIGGSMWFLAAIFVVAAKDFLIMFLAIGMLKVKYKVPATLEFAADSLLFLFGLFAYTATWVYLSGNMKLGTPSIEGPYFWSVVGGLYIFLFCFAPLEGPYIQEELALPRIRENRLRFWLFWGAFSANVICAMLTFVFNSW